MNPAGNEAIRALDHALAEGFFALPAKSEVLFLGARTGLGIEADHRNRWRCQQDFKPWADALTHGGWRLGTSRSDERHSLVVVLPPRQRERARALFAQAVDHAADQGVIVAAMANNEGARSAEDDLGKLARSSVESLSKHKCRVFRTKIGRDAIDETLLHDWHALDDIRFVAEGRFASRPGLFAWDRIDAGSALLAANLPSTLSGRVADLGGGYGYLAVRVLERCQAVTALDLYEADARALEPARINLERTQRGLPLRIRWHDVATGLPEHYNVIVSNPPFHADRSGEPALGQAFIRAAAAALLPHGECWLVANRHLPYEHVLRACFAETAMIADEAGFKVFCARAPRR